MAERREDVEEVLRLKSNPFPDGMLEAPEFPRRVYTTNVVQAVTSQIVAQTSRGPQLLKCEDTGELHVTIPPSVRPQKAILLDHWSSSASYDPNTAAVHTITVEDGWTLRILNIGASFGESHQSTTGYLEFNICAGSNYAGLAIVRYPYNMAGYISCSDPHFQASAYFPTTIDSFIYHIKSLIFDYFNPLTYTLVNYTDGIIQAGSFSVDTLYITEEI
jgi:hypothetical protein